MLALFCLCTAWLPAPAAMAAENAQDLFARAQRSYILGDYEKAVHDLKAALAQTPDNADYHHWLGRSYGRLAQHAGWIQALTLSRKTLHELEVAVDLDRNNIPALEDLMEYYREAPGFLGGSRHKAEQIARRLEVLGASGITQETAHTSANSPS